MADDLIEMEASKNPSAVQVRERRWEAPALAQLTQAEFDERLKMTQLQISRLGEIQRSIMKEGVDYGKVKGIDTPFLFQPGAQQLNRFAGLRPHYEVVKTYGDGIDTPAISFQVCCELIDPSGEIVSEGMGEANSHEKKHRYRYGDKICPKCGEATIRNAKKGDKDKYFCWERLGGCRATFLPDSGGARKLDAQNVLIENPDPHDLGNTCLKMACKRALVATTVNAHACSGQFSQDEPPPAERPEDAPKDAPAPQARAAQQKTQQRRSSGDRDSRPISEGQRKMCFAKLSHRLSELGHPVTDENRRAATEMILDGLDANEFADLTHGQLDGDDGIFRRIDTWE